MKAAPPGSMHSATPTLGISRGAARALVNYQGFYLNLDIVFQNSFFLIRLELEEQFPGFCYKTHFFPEENKQNSLDPNPDK